MYNPKSTPSSPPPLPSPSPSAVSHMRSSSGASPALFLSRRIHPHTPSLPPRCRCCRRCFPRCCFHHTLADGGRCNKLHIVSETTDQGWRTRGGKRTFALLPSQPFVIDHLLSPAHAAVFDWSAVQPEGAIGGSSLREHGEGSGGGGGGRSWRVCGLLHCACLCGGFVEAVVVRIG